MKIYVTELPQLKFDCPFADFCKHDCSRFFDNGVDKVIGAGEEECNLLKVQEEDPDK